MRCQIFCAKPFVNPHKKISDQNLNAGYSFQKIPTAFFNIQRTEFRSASILTANKNGLLE
jgi:hypothetical protein